MTTTVPDRSLVAAIDIGVFGAGEHQIRPRLDLAEAAVRRVADPLRLSLTDAALGIVEIINAKMANLLERVVVGRGFDPRDFVILSYGGSGPLHAAGLRPRAGSRARGHPGRGRIGVERVRDRALGRPLPPRARLSTDLAVSPRRAGRRLR